MEKIIQEALKKDGVLPCKYGHLQILNDGKCANSNWIAGWLAQDNQEYCECGFECKVEIMLERNGHRSYKYIVTQKELYDLIDAEEKR